MGVLQSPVNVDTTGREQSNGSVDVTAVKAIRRTPFNNVKTADGWCIAMGNEIISKPFKEFKEAVNYALSMPWDLILTAAAIYVESINKLKQQQNEQSKITR